MILGDIVKGLELIDVKGSLDREISGIAYDSRKAGAGSLFVCIDGFTTDGHLYVENAVENGARAFLTQKDVETPEDAAVIRIADTRHGLAHVSDTFFRHPSGRFELIGVTGTKGKTTTTYMVKSIMEAAGRKVGLIGSLGNMIGDEALYSPRTTPESYDLQELFSEMAERDVDCVVMEVSSQGLQLHRVSCCDFDTGIFTNLSRDHISPKEHADMDEYFNAKLKLFSMCKNGIVNIDTEHGRQVAAGASCKVYTCAIDRDADIRASIIQKNVDSSVIDMITPWGRREFKLGIQGRFNIYNALGAAGACCLAGVSADAVMRGLTSVKVPGRLEVLDTGTDFTIMVDYAHTPDSLENILVTVREYTPGRLVCLFGCGGDRDKGKRPEMGEISGRLSDFTIVTSDNPRTEDPEAIVREIEEGVKGTGGRYTVITDRREAIRYAIANAEKSDVIVLAGKGHETYQQFKDKTVHFDEREVVKEILGIVTK